MSNYIESYQTCYHELPVFHSEYSIPLREPFCCSTIQLIDLAYSIRGEVYYYLGRYKKAIADFNKAIELNTSIPKTNDAIYFRAQAKYFLNDYYGAIYDFTTFLEINYEFSEGYWNRGMVKEKIGDLNGACADYKKALSLSAGLQEDYDEKCN